ncbi:MAG: urea transporter [Bacteroidetes bacterium]|nr:urea transporter [Bacteroidota bacterium]MCW5895676.1 urea transporter [Bacteroidota bacterium]
MNLLLDSILYSYAQIFFSNRKWFGGVVLAATFVVPELGLVALLGVVLSNLTAAVLKFDEGKIRSGFYGFNGILFGAAAVFYFKLTPFFLVLIGIFIIITFLVSAVLEHHLAAVFNLPGLSLPFVLTLYVFIIFLTNLRGIESKPFEFTEPEFLAMLPPVVKTYFRSLGLIVFQSDMLSGVVFAVALLFLSRVMFTLSIVGFVSSLFFVDFVMQEADEWFLIFAGFNSILTAFALGGNLILPSKKSFLLSVISSLVVVILTGFFLKLLSGYQLPLLVLPFNFVVLSVIYSLKFRREQSDLVLLYFQPGTPEENYYYHHNRVSRFERFKAVVPELPFFGEWRVSQGQNGSITHKDKWRHAWDFVVTDEEGKEYANNGAALSDYYCNRLPVVAPLEGTVVRIVDGVPNNEVGAVNLKSNWGNTVIIDHGNNLFSAISHLEPHATNLVVGQRVKKGDTVGMCGNSGRSPTPHLHFQFQMTDKLGDKTFEHPIGHYLEKTENGCVLHTFDHPKENMLVRNIELHKIIRRTFEFTLGDKLSFVCSFDDEAFNEEWEVKVDILNSLFIESSAGATASVAMVGKIFYLTGFVGNKRSALYHFFLMAVQVPLCYEPNLVWTDRYPVSKAVGGAVRYLSEFLLVFSPQLNASASFRFAERSEESREFTISNNIRLKGTGLFSFYQKTLDGTLTIDAEGMIKEIRISAPGGRTFVATGITNEETSE